MRPPREDCKWSRSLLPPKLAETSMGLATGFKRSVGHDATNDCSFNPCRKKKNYNDNKKKNKNNNKSNKKKTKKKIDEED